MACPKISDFYRGDTKIYKFTFTGIDITGWDVWFTLKMTQNDIDDNASLQVKATAGDDPNDDPINGIMFLTVPSDVTNLVEPGIYFYDFQRVIDGTPPDVRTLLAGKIKILSDITREV